MPSLSTKSIFMSVLFGQIIGLMCSQNHFYFSKQSWFVILLPW